MSSDEGEHSDAEEKPTEAEQVLKKRREAQRQVSHGLDDAAKELLETNRKNREKLEEDIETLRKRNKQRKKEWAEVDKKLAAQRVAEDDRRKAIEDEKRKKKEEEDQKRQQARAKREAAHEHQQEQQEEVPKKSKEQLEAEKKAILKQRVKQLDDLGSLDQGQLADKAKELHKLITRLEGEKYDLEKRYKVQQIDMLELAERARQINKVGRTGLKRVSRAGEDIDMIQARFAGAPAKVEMFSIYERQTDKRSYKDRKTFHSGPRYRHAAERIKAEKIVKWGEDGLPFYEELEGAGGGEGHGGHELRTRQDMLSCPSSYPSVSKYFVENLLQKAPGTTFLCCLCFKVYAFLPKQPTLYYYSM